MRLEQPREEARKPERRGWSEAPEQRVLPFDLPAV
jgi:hypothetical protein